MKRPADADDPRPVAPGAASGHPVVRWLTIVVLAAACVVLALLLWRAREEVQRPRPVTLVSLTPAGSGALRSDVPGRPVVRPPPGNRVVVLLAYAGVADAIRFAAEIDPPTGEGPPRLVEVTRRSDEAFAVGLGTDPVPGQYKIVLYALEAEELRELAVYEFRIGMAEPREPAPPTPTAAPSAII